jgi:hypothetical protein
MFKYFIFLTIVLTIGSCKKTSNCCETEMKGIYKPFLGDCGNDPMIHGTIVMNGENYSISDISQFNFDTKTEQEVTFCGSIDKSKYFQIELTCIKSTGTYTNDNLCTNPVSATVKDLTGLDGCGFVLEIENGEKLEPTNLDKFTSFATNNTKVKVVYTDISGMASICMVRKIVKIECMEPNTSSN